MQNYYAAKIKNVEDERNSSSGGLFYALAEQVLNLGGVICGAAYNENLIVQHILIDSIEDLRKIQGSKYVQSELGDIFKRIRKEIINGKIVLFSGTPCQVNGLLSYLNNSSIEYFGKLITIEIICHGVPSPGIFRSYLKYKEKQHGMKVIEYNFRAKEKNRQFTLKYVTADKKNHFKNSLTDPFYAAFLKDIILRPSCYNCKFCGPNRKTDITLGDFWGIEKAKVNKKLKKSCSLLICNTENGRKLISDIVGNLIIERVDEKIAIANQPQINRTLRIMNVPVMREVIFHKWQEQDESVFFEYLRSISINYKKILFNLLPIQLIRMVKKVKK